MAITKCVCSDVSFARLLVIALRNDAMSIDELQKFISFGQQCGLCRTYIEEMLRSGCVVFEIDGTPFHGHATRKSLT